MFFNYVAIEHFLLLGRQGLIVEKQFGDPFFGPLQVAALQQLTDVSA